MLRGRLAIHICFLIGFRSRAIVMLQWAYSYFTYRRGARLITGPKPPPLLSQGPAAPAAVASRASASASAFLRAASNSSPGFQAGISAALATCMPRWK
jgi:NADH dehydrogenase